MSEGTAMMEVTIDGRTATVSESDTIFAAAQQLGIEIPALCHRPDLGLDPVAVCRACLVDTGEKNFAAACIRKCGTLRDERSGKVKPVQTATPGIESARRTLVELLLIDHPTPCARHRDTLDCELELLGERYGLLAPLREPNAKTARYHTPDEPPTGQALGRDYGRLASPFVPRTPRNLDISNFSIAVDHSACILCDRCVRACNDVAGFDIIGRHGKGPEARIGFDANAPMGKSGCVNCGHCMVACPTGALQFTGPRRRDMAGIGGAGAGRDGAGLFADALPLDVMQDLEFIRDAKVPPNFLKRLEGGIRIRSFAKGAVLCRQGEMGDTAFYIDSGSVDVYLETPPAAPAPPASAGLMARIGAWFTPADVVAERPATPPPTPVGHPEPIARVPEAESVASRLLGEASCRNGQPRNATLRAHEDTIVFEMGRDVLEVLLRSPKFRADFDRVNKHRLVQNLLRKLDLFCLITPRELDDLKNRSELVSCQPGQVVFRRGDPADAIYIVRLGQVKIEVEGNVINYLSPGQHFGELAVLSGNARTATCTAMNHAELLRVPRDVVDEVVKNYPQVGQALRGSSDRRQVRDRYRNVAQNRPRTLSLHQYIDQQLYEGQSLLLIDLERCTRCDECVRACAQSHGGVGRLIRDGQRFEKYLIPTACRSCHDPKCLGGCPVNAIHRTAHGGLAIVIENWCVGCGFCFGQDHDGKLTGTGCPYGNISPVPRTLVDPVTGDERTGRIATVCDLDGCTPEGVDPSCVYACPHEAAQRVNAHEFFGIDLLRGVGADV